MKQLAILVVSALSGLLAGCSQQPASVPVESLAFPVVLITGTSPRGTLPSRARIVVNKEDLGLMRVLLYTELTDTVLSDPPIVIDSAARMLDMKDIKGKHGGLWMMVNPNGLMPIRFTLIRRKETGFETARATIARSRFIGRSLDSEGIARRRAGIAAATSMSAVIGIIDEPR